jgi:hypothetical protein
MTINQTEMYHSAIEKLFRQVADAGHNVESLTNITLCKRFNPQSGNHVHVTASLKLRFDVSVVGNEKGMN